MKNLSLFVLVSLSLLMMSCCGADRKYGRIVNGNNYQTNNGNHSFCDQDDVEWMGIGQGTEVWATGCSGTGELRDEDNTAGDLRDAPCWCNWGGAGIGLLR